MGYFYFATAGNNQFSILSILTESAHAVRIAANSNIANAEQPTLILSILKESAQLKTWEA